MEVHPIYEYPIEADRFARASDVAIRITTAHGGAPLISRKTAPTPDCVLIVDRSEDSREVLQTALERRGLRTVATDSAELGLRLASSHRPQVIVLDVESRHANDDEVRARYAARAQGDNLSLIILGTARSQIPPDSRNRFVSKPYHYAPLIRTIEQLLEQ